jgi:hypothetical protein
MQHENVRSRKFCARHFDCRKKGAGSDPSIVRPTVQSLCDRVGYESVSQTPKDHFACCHCQQDRNADKDDKP